MLTHIGTPQAESRYSWTVDFAARRAEAQASIQPHIDRAATMKEEVILLKERLKTLKKEKKSVIDIKESEEKVYTLEKSIRDAESIASDIDAKVFDLKAVNPNAVVKMDNRTTLEIIQNIEAHSKIVEEAMKNLKLML